MALFVLIRTNNVMPRLTLFVKSSYFAVTQPSPFPLRKTIKITHQSTVIVHFPFRFLQVIGIIRFIFVMLGFDTNQSVDEIEIVEHLTASTRLAYLLLEPGRGGVFVQE